MNPKLDWSVVQPLYKETMKIVIPKILSEEIVNTILLKREEILKHTGWTFIECATQSLQDQKQNKNNKLSKKRLEYIDASLTIIEEYMPPRKKDLPFIYESQSIINPPHKG